MSKLQLTPEKKADGTLYLRSNRFGVGVTFGMPGTFQDAKTGEVKRYGEFIKITSGDFSLKLTPLGLAWLRAALESAEMDAELSRRVQAEREAFAKELGMF